MDRTALSLLGYNNGILSVFMAWMEGALGVGDVERGVLERGGRVRGWRKELELEGWRFDEGSKDPLA